MTLLNWKRLSLSTATLIFFVLVTIFNIYMCDFVSHTTCLSVNLTCVLLCQLGVALYSKLMDCVDTKEESVEEIAEQVHFCDIQRKVLVIMSVCFIIWMV